MSFNPYQVYQKNSIMTMTRGEMLSKLYDKIIQELTASKLKMEKKDVHLYKEIDASLKKAKAILNYLKSTLNFKYDVANNLNKLYDYFISQIMASYVNKDSAPLEEIIPMITDLQSTYEKADKMSRSGGETTASQA